MICERCKEREAAIEFTAIVGDTKKTMHLCPECSKAESDIQTQAGLEEETDTKGSKVNVVVGHLADTEAKKGSCPDCGMTYDEFRKIGRLGCSRCYTAFGASMQRLLKRIHGSDTHVGRGQRPVQQVEVEQEPDISTASTDVDELRTALQAAVDAEEYERAAQLRDRINRLQEREAE